MSVTQVSAINSVDPPLGAARPNGPASETVQQPSQQRNEPSAPPAAVAHRFPWLSWETRQLEAASKQPSPYGRTPLLGETLDQKV